LRFFGKMRLKLISYVHNFLNKPIVALFKKLKNYFKNNNYKNVYISFVSKFSAYSFIFSIVFIVLSYNLSWIIISDHKYIYKTFWSYFLNTKIQLHMWYFYLKLNMTYKRKRERERKRTANVSQTVTHQQSVRVNTFSNLATVNVSTSTNIMCQFRY